MRVPQHLVDRRREELRGLIRRDGFLPVAEICRRLGVSAATARRDHRQTDPWGARIRQRRLGAALILPDEEPKPSGEAQEDRVLEAVLTSTGMTRVDAAIHEAG